MCDTDSFATLLWQERYQGFVSPEVVNAARGRREDLYLLTDCAIPFEQDGTRDGEHLRGRMQRRFEEALRGAGRPFLLLSRARRASASPGPSPPATNCWPRCARSFEVPGNPRRADCSQGPRRKAGEP